MTAEFGSADRRWKGLLQPAESRKRALDNADEDETLPGSGLRPAAFQC
jgi:hypothetical protein